MPPPYIPIPFGLAASLNNLPFAAGPLHYLLFYAPTAANPSFLQN